jgi:menaquinone-dependent protoporphyrinogen oxidase
MGSTQEVAEAMAATMREQGLTVDVRPAREVTTLDGYEAVVLGAALYMFRWHKDAKRFLGRQRKALATRPLAIFALGPLGKEEKEMQEARAQLDKELAKFPWLAPLAVEVFVGKLDPTKVGFPGSLFMKQIPASDLRDWDAIRAWAAEVAGRLVPAPVLQ